jgi:hypothetical protein
MDDDLDLLRFQTKQPAGFDDLQGLVHQCRGVDRNLLAHVPGRMLERLLGSYIREISALLSAKWAAARGEHDSLDLARRASLHRLVDGAVLAIDGEDAGVLLFGKLHDERASHHQRLFVGDGDGLARVQGEPGAGESCSADDGGENDVHVGIADHRADRVVAAEQPRAGDERFARQSLGSLQIGRMHVAGSVAMGLLE